MEISETALCHGCLCGDRKIKIINNTPIKGTYSQIINEISNSELHIKILLLCWECEALLTRFIKFKIQLKSCYEEIRSNSNLQNISILRRPSKLNFFKIENVQLGYDDFVNNERFNSQLISDEIKKENSISDNETEVKHTFNGTGKKKKKSKVDYKNKRKPRENHLKRSTLAVDNAVIINANFNCEKCNASFTNEQKYLKHNKIKHNMMLLGNLTHPSTEISEDSDIDTSANISEEVNNLDLETEVKVERFDDSNINIVEMVEYKHLIEKKTKKRVKGVRSSKRGLKEMEVVKEIILTAAEIDEERVLLAQNDEYVNAMFKCQKCIASFANNDDFEDHLKFKHETGEGKFLCNICQRTFNSEISYNYHMNRHSRRYQCVVCSETFYRKGTANRHYEKIHTNGSHIDHQPNEEMNGGDESEVKQESNIISSQRNGASFPCDFCQKTFRWKTSLRKHLETHRIETGQKRKPYCEPCSLSFSTTSNLQKHVRTSSKHQVKLKLRKLKESLSPDSGEEKAEINIDLIKQSVCKSKQKYSCQQCGKTFLWRGNLQRHELAHQARANGDLVCKPCNRSFSSIATFNQHMAISKKHVSENDFKYMCSDCGKRFANKTRLRDHVNWEHLKKYLHTCDVCSKVFQCHTTLYIHKQVVHNKDNVQHLCDHCGKHFPNQSKLRSHILALHMGKAPYQCRQCPARFNWHSCLSRHCRRTHKSTVQHVPDEQKTDFNEEKEGI